jgi:MFS family permease
MSNRPAADRDVAALFLRWTYLRAVFVRGYWTVASLYLVVDAHLSAFQLLLLGTFMGITLVLSDIPTGVWSDGIGRKWPLVIGHLFVANGMVMIGLVNAFPLILVTQISWGLGWAFISGADVAWLTDELDRPDRIDQVLTARARWDLCGGITGMLAFGVLAWATGRATAIVLSGLAMAVLGLFVAAQFSEHNFTPVRERQWTASLSIFRRGLSLARRDPEILLMFAATMLINAVSEMTRLFPKQLVNLGLPNDPMLCYAALGILASATGAIALRIIEAHIMGVGVARRFYAVVCFVGFFGMIVLAYASDILIGCLGVLLLTGITFNVTRAVSVIWVNRRITTDVRATVHSCLSQAESIGEIFGGFALALLAKAAGIPIALTAAGAILAFAGAMVVRSGADRAPKRADESPLNAFQGAKSKASAQLELRPKGSEDQED